MSRLMIVFTLQLIAPYGFVADLVSEILNSAGYPCEIHHVITEDGYNLTLHRIPPKRNISIRPEVFILMHGLIGSSADFILPGKDKGLGCILHDEGYDVWMPNCRGNTWSKNHLWLNPQFPQFWNFSFHEIGIYDVPAVVDKVINHTGNKLVHYAGHSQGTTVFFVMLSQIPKYNKKIASAHLLAPVAYLGNVDTLLSHFVTTNRRELEIFFKNNGFYELFPSTPLNEVGGEILCGVKSPLQPLCIFLVYMIVGFSGFEIDRKFFSNIFKTTPAGCSLKQALHFTQLMASGKFQQYNYGNQAKNYEHYGNVAPPKYNLANVRIPLNLYSGGQDALSNPKDVNKLVLELNNPKNRLTTIPEFNHMDLIYSTHAPNLICKEIVSRTRILKSSKPFT